VLPSVVARDSFALDPRVLSRVPTLPGKS